MQTFVMSLKLGGVRRDVQVVPVQVVRVEAVPKLKIVTVLTVL
jgi:hypothetical protein